MLSWEHRFLCTCRVGGRRGGDGRVKFKLGSGKSDEVVISTLLFTSRTGSVLGNPCIFIMALVLSILGIYNHECNGQRDPSGRYFERR